MLLLDFDVVHCVLSKSIFVGEKELNALLFSLLLFVYVYCMFTCIIRFLFTVVSWLSVPLV